jgi:adenine-specific DNA-methyltransferase
LLQWNEFFISKIETAEDPDSLLTIWDQIQQRGHLSYKVDPKSIDANVKDFKDLSLQDQKRFLLEVLDKNALYVNYSEIDDMEYGVSDEDKRLNHQFYGMEA